MPARALMFQGTGSDVGKSLLVAGFARLLRNQGLKVAPFKPQNMSNNAAVTADGGEIGRAQALQARAAGMPPSVHMNPVLLKPQSEVGSQVVVQGRVVGNATARDYQAMKPALMDAVLASFKHLCAVADIVLVEGAGSASEVNLRNGDIANMGFARAGDVPVVLIGDIDRGGVIASLVGTKVVLTVDDAAMIEGFIVNKFRGDPSLFADGMALVAGHTGWQPLGLVPYFADAGKLPAEDALGLKTGAGCALERDRARPLIAVLAYPHISNFDDFDPLRLEPGVDVMFVVPGQRVPEDAALVVLPGSKATISDLAAVRANGWDKDVARHVARGGSVLGVCGGYQMLGRCVGDPAGIEGPPCNADGLGLLDIETELTGDKLLAEISGVSLEGEVPFQGYEMHVGRTHGADCLRPVLRFADGRLDGAVREDGRVAGCYVHGLFADDSQRAAWLRRIGAQPSALSYNSQIEETLDGLAEHLSRHVDCDALLSLARAPRFRS